MQARNGWKVWVIGTLSAVLLSFGGLAAKSHLDSVEDVRKKAEAAMVHQAATSQQIQNVKEKVDEIKEDVKEIKRILQDRRRIQ